LAIGTSGSNVKLVSQLCDYKVDIKSISQYKEDMTTLEARDRLHRLFNPNLEPESEEVEEEGGTPLSEVPGLTPRVISIL
jgi:N utilization substance protein A